MTKEDYESLLPFRDSIMKAYKQSFLRMSSGDFEKVAVIYDRVTGKPLTRSQKNCNTCRLNALRKLGEEMETYERGKERKSRKKKMDNGGTEENE